MSLQCFYELLQGGIGRIILLAEYLSPSFNDNNTIVTCLRDS